MANMFSTTLHSRPSLHPLIALLLSSRDPIFKERSLQTHDLALALPNPPSSSVRTDQQQAPLAPPTPSQIHHHHHHLLFLLLTSSDLSPEKEPATLQRIARLGTLTAWPVPSIAFILDVRCPGADDGRMEGSEGGGTDAYMHLQSVLHLHSSTNTSSDTDLLPTPPPPPPPPILPIPSLAYLLPLLKSYVSSTSIQPTPSPPTPLSQSQRALALLPYITTAFPNTLPPHAVHVLSDLCHSIKEVAWICEREEGREILREWLGDEVAAEVMGFWAGNF